MADGYAGILQMHITVHRQCMSVQIKHFPRDIHIAMDCLVLEKGQFIITDGITCINNISTGTAAPCHVSNTAFFRYQLGIYGTVCIVIFQIQIVRAAFYVLPACSQKPDG